MWEQCSALLFCCCLLYIIYTVRTQYAVRCTLLAARCWSLFIADKKINCVSLRSHDVNCAKVHHLLRDIWVHKIYFPKRRCPVICFRVRFSTAEFVVEKSIFINIHHGTKGTSEASHRCQRQELCSHSLQVR